MARRKGKKGKGRGQRKRPATGAPKLVVYRGLQYMPPRFQTTLRFTASNIVSNSLNTYANFRYEPTYAYDIDPSLGSTVMPGFSEFMLMYRQYRVNWFKATCRFSSREAFPTMAYLCPVNFDPSVNTANYQNYLSSRSARIKPLGSLTGNGACTVSLPRVSVASFAGARQNQSDDGTVGSSTSAPANNIWVIIGLTGTANLTNGAYFLVTIDIDLDFMELASPSA